MGTGPDLSNRRVAHQPLGPLGFARDFGNRLPLRSRLLNASSSTPPPAVFRSLKYTLTTGSGRATIGLLGEPCPKYPLVLTLLAPE